MKNKMVMIAALFAAAGTGVASAAQMQIDIDSLTSQAYDMHGGVAGGGSASSFSLLHSGSVELNFGANSAVFAVLFDGIGQGPLVGSLTGFNAVINLTLGQVVGGTLNLTTTLETFSAVIQSGVGQVNNQAGAGFSIDGLIASAWFSDDMFLGQDISPWYDTQPLDGSFINLAFSPDASGFDSGTDVDIFVNTNAIPTPLAGGMAGIGLMGLAARRRRA